jgi:transcriptional regulator GlxA family with amidase domain
VGYAGAELVLSVCTGALVLGQAGLLDGRDATTHAGAFETLREIAPSTTVRENCRYIDTGRVITAAGVSAGVDMALYVVRRLLGDAALAVTLEKMEYHWTAAH